MQCAAHPTVETELGCSRCGKPICVRCIVQTPVGARCRECANVRRLPTYNVGKGTMLRAVVAAVASGVVLGIAWWIFNPLTGLFFGFIIGLALGTGVGQTVSTATNRRAGPPLQAAAVGGVLLACVVRTGLLFALSEWRLVDFRTDIWGLAATGIAVFVALGRLR